MAWSPLPVNYTDAVWSGLKKYIPVNNEDDTVSFQDVTEYSNRENSFFGALNANSMNETLNILMSLRRVCASKAYTFSPWDNTNLIQDIWQVDNTEYIMDIPLVKTVQSGNESDVEGRWVYILVHLPVESIIGMSYTHGNATHTFDATDVTSALNAGGGNGSFLLEINLNDLYTFDSENAYEITISEDTEPYCTMNFYKRNTSEISGSASATTVTVTPTKSEEFIYATASGMAAVTVNLNAGYCIGFICSVVFISGETPTTFAITNTGEYTLTYKGDDIDSTSPTLQSNKTYTVLFDYDGINMNVTTRAV